MDKNQENKNKFTVNKNRNIYFNGLKCFLDTYASATYMR